EPPATMPTPEATATPTTEPPPPVATPTPTANAQPAITPRPVTETPPAITPTPRGTPSASGRQSATSTPPPTPTATPTLPPSPPPPPEAARATPPPPAAVADEHLNFPNIKLLTVIGKKATDQDVLLSFTGGQISLAPKNGGSAILTIPYKSIVHATYVKSRDPRWDASL